MYSSDDNFVKPLPDSSALGAGPSASLTYEPFYGLREKPFSLSADPRFLYKSPAHAPAFDALLMGIRRREGLIVLTGEIGTGKTTLCRSVLQHLDRRTFAAFVPDPFVSREDLLKTLLVDFGVISISDLTRGRFNGASRSELSYPLYEFLDSLVPLQAFAVLVIDETQNLSLPLLEEIRILSELERREKLLQVVLVGQPELRSSLSLPQMRQVDQRVSVRCELTALDADGVAGYVNHRLFVAGRGESGVEFTRRGARGAVSRIGGRAARDQPPVRSRARARAMPHGPGESTHSSSGTQSRSRPRVRVFTIDRRPKPRGETSNCSAAGAGATARAGYDPGAQIEASSPLLEEFNSEAELPLARPAPASIARSPTRQRWTTVAVVVGSCRHCIGGSTRLVSARSNGEQRGRGGAAAADSAGDLFRTTLHAAKRGAYRAAVFAVRRRRARCCWCRRGEGGTYTIVVASFTSQARAERLVEELTNAGYRAQAVERDWGPPRGRLLQVNVGGYTSAIEVQRDLQQIRELPGGYRDARIVERE